MQKVFCVGLHKTGTSSLHELFKELGLRSLHATNWWQPPLPSALLEKYDAFSDGGGHFWDPAEPFGGNHPVSLLRETYPDSKFILQVRDLEPWLVSKMMHARWNKDTQIVDEEAPLKHDDWRHKSLKSIEAWILNRRIYHRAAVDYLSRLPQDVLVLDVIRDPEPVRQVTELLYPGADITRVEKMSFARRRANKKAETPLFVPMEMPRENVGGSNPDYKAFCRGIAAQVVASVEPDPHDTPDGIKAQFRAAVSQPRNDH